MQTFEHSPDRFSEARVSAVRRLQGTGAGVALLAGTLVALLVSPLIGLAAFVVLGAAWLLWIRSVLAGALSRVVDADGARLVDPREVPSVPEASLCNALEGMALLTGVSVPEIHILDSEAANAMCAASGEDAAVVVTTGLLHGVRPIELEAVAAELLCRLRDGSAALGTLASGLPPALAGICGLGEQDVTRLLGDQRAVRADLDAVSLTKYPPALVAVLTRMSERGTAVPDADPRSSWLWLAPVVDSRVDGGVAPDRTAEQPIAHRIAVLQEL